MPLATAFEPLAVDTDIVDLYTATENDQAFSDGNALLTTGGAGGTSQVIGYLGDGPFAGTTGDIDHYIIGFVPATRDITVDLDSAIFGEALDAKIEILDSDGVVVDSNDSDDGGGPDPYLHFQPTTSEIFYVRITGVGEGAYRLVVSNQFGSFQGDDGVNVQSNITARTIVGHAGDDELGGHDGRNIFQWSPGDGDDTFDGAGGFDGLEVTHDGGGGIFSLTPGGGEVVLDGPAGDITTDNIERLLLRGLGGDDRLNVPDLTGTEMIQTIRFYGGRGDDRLAATPAINAIIAYGDSGADVLRSGSGADSLFGGSGKDVLLGGAAVDRLEGGSSADRFDYDSHLDSGTGADRDVIADFSRAEKDRIDLSDIDAKTGSGNQAFTFIGKSAFSGVKGELRFKNGILGGDRNGDGAADFQIALTDVTKLVGADIVL